MKILFSQKIHGISGSEKYFFNIIPSLQSKGLKIHFLVFYVDIEEAKLFVETLQSLGVKVHCVNISGIRIFASIFSTIKILKEEKYDIVHSHLIHSDLLFSLVKMGYSKFKLVSTKHGYDEMFISRFGLSGKKKVRNSYYYTCLFSEKFIDKSYAVSNGLANVYYELGITKYLPEVIWHGVQVEEGFNPTYIDESQEKYILVLGRLVPFKGHEKLFQAFSLIKDDIPNTHIKVVGLGDEKQRLEALAKELNISSKVDFVGFVSDVNAVIDKCQFIVAPSSGEGFGLVILEAFVRAKPAITFDVAAFNEFIDHNVSGFLIPPYSIEEFGKAMSFLIKNKKECQRMSLAAFEKAKGELSIETCVNKTISFYKRNQ